VDAAARSAAVARCGCFLRAPKDAAPAAAAAEDDDDDDDDDDDAYDLGRLSGRPLLLTVTAAREAAAGS
jgi:hypothetical protein